MGEPENDKAWHLDRRVPLALIFAILVQTAGAFWWASSISSRVANLETQVANQAATNIPSVERMTRVETKLDAMREDVNDIKRALHTVTGNAH